MKEKEDLPIIDLFFSFLRLGLTAFGGPAMIAYIRKYVVEKRKWMSHELFSNGIALCQVIPGASAIQMSAYVGLKLRGIIGASVSFIGFGLPSFIFILLLSSLYVRYKDLPYVVSAFGGLQAITVTIIANALISFIRTTITDWKTIAIALAAAFLYLLKIHPIFVIFASSAAGILLFKSIDKNYKSDSHIIHNNNKFVTIYLSILLILLSGLYHLKKELFLLSTTMLRIDLLAFGGGFTSIPLMYHEFVNTTEQIDGATLMNGIALGQVTPGPIVITATFIGYILHGFIGGLVATISIFTPSFLILVGTVPYYDRICMNPHFFRAVKGILCSFVGLLAATTLNFAQVVNWNLAYLLIAISSLIALLLKVDILIIVLCGMFISIIITYS